MTLTELIDRLRALGFLCDLVESDDPKWRHYKRLFVAKRVDVAGNRLGDDAGVWATDDLPREALLRLLEGDDVGLPKVHRPKPTITIDAGVIHFEVNNGHAPGRRLADKTLASLEDVYEELLHTFFDPDSPLATEPDFVPGSGRPPGA